MSTTIYITFGLFVLIFLFGCVLLVLYKVRKKLNKKEQDFYKKCVLKSEKISSKKERIIDLDKIYHKILLSIGHKGHFGSILKTNPKEINDINKIWELHKLRNKLVHDLNSVPERVLERSTTEYTLQINQLLKQVS